MALSTDPRDAEIADLKAALRDAVTRIRELERQNAELLAKLGQNSTNSSKPPSTDGPGTKKEPTKPKGRKRGGQPGHEGAKRTRLPPTKISDHWPADCAACDRPLPRRDAPGSEAKWCQVLELPEIRPDVHEHRAHAALCDCGAVTEAVLPDVALMHGFGPRLAAVVAYMTGNCRISKRQVVEFADAILGTPISLGAVCAIEKDVSEALAEPVERLREAVRNQPVVHADETGWRLDKKRAWLWVAVTSIGVVFRVAKGRGAAVAKELLGKGFLGLLVTDRWCGYNWVGTVRRQLCWAHLLRDLVGMTERGGVGAEIGSMMLADAQKMMRWWVRIRDGTLDRKVFKKRMKPVRARVGRLLRDAAARAEPKTSGMCEEILKLEAALWTFIDVDGLEPTNNVAERAIRHAVLWRKGSFGNDSQVGAEFAERILTAVATIRLRGGSVLEYLATACASHRLTRTAPSLLAVGGQ